MSEVNPEISIIKIEGKPVTKLIEVVSAAIGRVYTPTAIRKEADAESYKYEVITHSKAKAALLFADTENEIQRRTQERLILQEVRNQENIESIIKSSLKYLPEAVSEEIVDPDWTTRFFDSAEKVSNKMLQEAWAKVLAKEVSTPGSFSYRTLESLSNLSSEEAKIFEKVCSFSFFGLYLFKINANQDFEKYGIDYRQILLLQSAGLITYASNLNVKYPAPDHEIFLNYSGKIVKLSNPDLVEFRFDDYKFTPAGEELASVIECHPNLEFLNDFIESFKLQNYTAEIIS